MRHRMTIIGCGPGAHDFLTLQAIQAVDEAEVLVGAERLLDLFPDKKVPRIVLRSRITAVLDEMERDYFDRRIAVLVSGDPGLFSLAKPVVERFGAENCRIIPGISAVQLAFARLGLSWVDTRIISLHHALPDTPSEELASCPSVAILIGHPDSYVWIKGRIQPFERTPRIVVCENLGEKNEQVRDIFLEDLTRMVFSRRSIVLLIQTRIDR